MEIKNESKKQINLLYQCDNNFAFLVGVSMTSLLYNASEEVFYNIYLLTPDMNDENRKKFARLKDLFPRINYSLTFLDAAYCEEIVKQWNAPSHRGSYVTYYKLFIDRYLKDSGVQHVLHLGADTLVMGDLSELSTFDFGGAPFAMNWSSKEMTRYFPRNYRHAIAEMIYFNLPEWRRQRCEERVRRHFEEIGDIYGSKDQGVLNMEFQFEYAQLPLKYNVYGITYSFSDKYRRKFNNAPVITDKEVEEAYAYPEIIHIPRTFLYRPHEKGSLEPLKELWWEYCRKSPWSDMQPMEPFPKLGIKEKLCRYVFSHFPASFCGWFYCTMRFGYGRMLSLTHKPLPEDKRVIGKLI